MSTPRRLLLVAAVAAVSMVARAQVPAPERVRDVQEAARATRLTELSTKAADVARAQLVAKTSTAESAAPDPFAERVHASYQDFLSFLSFAINAVEPSADGRAIALRLNPVRSGALGVGGSVTATKPQTYESVQNALPLATRASVIAALDKQQSDVDDLLWSVALTVSTSCDPGSSRRCLGRDPASYRSILSRIMLKSLTGVTSAITSPGVQYEHLTAQLEQLNVELAGGGVAPQTLWSDVPAAQRDEIRRLATAIGRLEAERDLEIYERFEATPVAIFADLVGNQPQLAGNVSYRRRGRLTGPDEFALTAEWSWGTDNLNKILRKARATPPADNNALIDRISREAVALQAKGLSKDRFVLVASYKRRTRFDLSTIDIGTPVADFTPIHEGSADEFTLRAQWGAELKWLRDARQPRIDASLEGLVTHNDQIREKQRWIASATLTVPVGEHLRLPLTVTWANRAEFLTEQRKQWGAHVGLSYRLPWDPVTP